MSDFRTNNLTKTYGEADAVRQITVELRRGELVGLLGHNGSGKTTLLRMLAGVVIPTSGSIADRDGNLSGLQLRMRCTYIPDEFSLPQHWGVTEVSRFYRLVYGAPEGQVADIGEWIQTDPSFGTASRGQRQLMRLHALSCRLGELVLLDEPTSALDQSKSTRLWEILREIAEDGRVVVVASHMQDDVSSFCHRVLHMEGGFLHEGHGG